MSDLSQSDGFDDLEEMDHVEVERMKGDFERSLRSVERQHSDLRGERRDQVSLVRSLRTTVGEMEQVSGVRRSLLGEFHTVRKAADKARRGRDEVNIRIPPPAESWTHSPASLNYRLLFQSRASLRPITRNTSSKSSGCEKLLLNWIQHRDLSGKLRRMNRLIRTKHQLEFLDLRLERSAGGSAR